MKLLIMLLITSVYSCSSKVKNTEKSTWHGRTLTEVTAHPYFKSLYRYETLNKDGTQIWTFRDTTPGYTQGHCATIGGCRTLAMLYCEYHFTIKNDQIVELDKSGTCPMSEKVWSPKKI